MRAFLRSGLYFFALLGVAFVGITIYGNFFSDGCVRTSETPIKSFNGETYAVFVKTVCPDLTKSRSMVVMGRPGQTERTVALEITETTDAQLAWNGSSQLRVILPRDARVKAYNTGDMPQVVVVRQ